MKKFLTIALTLLFSAAAAAAQTVVIYEGSGVVSAHTITGPSLTSIRTLPYSSLNRDFTGVPTEDYDVFFSNSTGTQASDSTSCVTIRGQYNGQGLGFNITRVDLNTSSSSGYYSTLTTHTLGDEGDSSTAPNAADSSAATLTLFGRATGKRFMHVTLCEVRALPDTSFDPCCPPINPRVVKDQLVYRGSGPISSPYTLKFQPSPLTSAMTSFNNSMQAYLNYVSFLSLGANAMTSEWRLHYQGTGTIPMTWPGGSSPGNNGPLLDRAWTTWTAGGSGPVLAGTPNFFGSASGPNQFPMLPNTWYMIHTGTYFEGGIEFFDHECADNDFFVNVRVLELAGRTNPVLEIRDAKGEIIERRELEQIK
ncbi:MAG TPA: hypothetical protein VGO50_20770 [Pyrinomonadaceae bacterium]|jgi:hypothetical protein|nr:hypothetical protein [Pyrinomonadaceae bacterium]